VNFTDKLTNACRKNNSLVCVGLDPDPQKMPDGKGILEFNREIIEATSDLVCAYKLNFAFYEAQGDEGMNALKRSVEHIPDHILKIGDAKRGDIGNTAKAYARAVFDIFGFDATTVNPYLGFDSTEPFLEYKDKGIFILCRTSNAGAADFQSLVCRTESGNKYLYEIVALKAREWNTNNNIGLVVGATYPEELRQIRQQHPDIPLLIPGIGAQGGELEKAIRFGVDDNGEKAIINSSRQIIYASQGEDFAQAARKAAISLHDEINSYRTVT